MSRLQAHDRLLEHLRHALPADDAPQLRILVDLQEVAPGRDAYSPADVEEAHIADVGQPALPEPGGCDGGTQCPVPRAVLLQFDGPPAELLPLPPGLVSCELVLTREPLLSLFELLARLLAQGVGLRFHSLALVGELGPPEGAASFDRLPLRRGQDSRLPFLDRGDKGSAPCIQRS